ncbi:MAG: amidohydrolase [Candidatus Bathyarchaeia archaeon]
MDIIIKDGIIITMNRERRILKNGAIAIEGNRIVDIGKTEDLEKKYKADKKIDAKGMIVMPGLICVHNHMFAYLLRNMIITPPIGLDTSETFGKRLTTWYWPKFEDTCTKEDAYIGALLMSVDMLKNGITCTADTLEAPNAIPEALDITAKAIEKTGIRAILTFEASERLSMENGELGLKTNLEFLKKWNSKKDSRIKGAMCVHTAFSCSPDYLVKTKKAAVENNARILIHIAQSPFEVEFIRENYGKRGSVFFLNDLGFLGPDVLAAHCIYVSDEELDIISRTDTKVSFNVLSNMRAGNGVAPVLKLLRKGVTVGLGLDGDWADLFELMMCTNYLLSVYHLQRNILKAEKLIEMATIDGAKTLGLEKEVGSIEVGKKADIILIKIAGDVHFAPVEDYMHLIANYVRGPHVHTVIVDGNIVVENRSINTVNEEEIIQKAEKQAKEYKNRVESASTVSVWIPPWKK